MVGADNNNESTMHSTRLALRVSLLSVCLPGRGFCGTSLGDGNAAISLVDGEVIAFLSQQRSSTTAPVSYA